MRTSFLNINKKVFSTRFNSLFNYTDPTNPRVYLKVAKNNEEIGNLVFELYKNHCPKTVNNFLQIASGAAENLSYKNTVFEKITKGFCLQGGNVVDSEGNETSVYGENFPDENLRLKHTKRGVLTMDNHGSDSNSSRFMVTFTDTPWLDGYHVVIGELVEGENVLAEIENHGTREGTPKAEIKVVDCGQLL